LGVVLLCTHTSRKVPSCLTKSCPACPPACLSRPESLARNPTCTFGSICRGGSGGGTTTINYPPSPLPGFGLVAAIPLTALMYLVRSLWGFPDSPDDGVFEVDRRLGGSGHGLLAPVDVIQGNTLAAARHLPVATCVCELLEAGPTSRGVTTGERQREPTNVDHFGAPGVG